MKPLNPNSMIQGRYLIVQPIGKGGMGEVYLAVDQRLGSAVALKRTFFSEDSTLGTAFEREARILARLRHPVLPKVIDHFAENGDQYLVMEHISGDDIAKRIEAANKPFPVSWVMFWSDQMLDALAYLHSHEPPIVHRDIKPQNLKLTDDNHIVLLDFGLSKDFDSNSGGLNSASVAGYSPHFASMEQIRGTGTDARSDLYSLAATLYQMLTNSVPVDALTRADAMLGGKPDPIKPLNELNAEVTPAISDVILKAVSIRQDSRYSSALEMQKALRRAFNAEKSEASTKPGTEPKITAVAAAPVVTPTPVVEEVSESPEFETQIRGEALVPLDATLQFDPPKADSQPRPQSEQKTAVYSMDTGQAGLNDSANEPKQTAEPVKTAAAAAGLSSAASASPPVGRAVPQPRVQPQQKAKKSKAGLIVGLLLALVLLGGAGGGAAWWILNNRGGSTSANQNSNVNAATPSSTPMQANSNAVVPPANTDIGSSNTETPANTNTAASSTPSPSNSRTASTTAPPPKQQPKPNTPSDKPSPPKTKPKDDRTVILQ